MMSRRTLGLLLGLVLSCGGKEPQPASVAAGSSGSAGAGAGGAGTGASAGAGAGSDAAGTPGSGGLRAACPGPTPARAPLANAGRIDLPVTITINGAPADVGVAGAGRDGREYRLSLFKFFVSEPTLVAASGLEAPAQLVSAEGAPLPYGLHLVDADDPTTQQLHLATDMGSYTALRLGVGVPAACNAMPVTNQVYPLNPDSDMFWTWGSQFMFIRIEGSTRTSSSGEWAPFLYHVGYDPAFVSLTIPGAIQVGPGGSGPTLSLDIDLMLANGSEPLPAPKHAVPDGWVVDNLEANQAFTLQ
jgi:hypothetical protein